MNPAGSETAVPASERPQTYALDRAAAGIGALHTRVAYNQMTSFNAIQSLNFSQCNEVHLVTTDNSATRTV
jgi:hypothetical protein